MQVLVDTSVWSLALRRRGGVLSAPEKRIVAELADLIDEARAELIGPVRQELLSGIRDAAQYERLREHLRGFPDPVLSASDYEQAARSCNQCRAAGVVGSSVDFLICAISVERGWPIFTTDLDFRAYAEVLPLILYEPRKSSHGG